MLEPLKYPLSNSLYSFFVELNVPLPKVYGFDGWWCDFLCSSAILFPNPVWRISCTNHRVVPMFYFHNRYYNILIFFLHILSSETGVVLPNRLRVSCNHHGVSKIIAVKTPNLIVNLYMVPRLV